MRHFMLLCAVAISFMNVARAEGTVSPSCRLKMVASIDLTVRPDGGVLLPVTLDGASYQMRLNLGSAFSLVSKSILDEKKIPYRPIEGVEVGYGKTRIRQLTHLDHFAIGSAQYGRVEFLVLPDEASVSAPVIGALGMDVFGGVDVELDLAHRKLNLISQDHCPGQVVYWSREYAEAPMRRGPLGNVFFPIELDGKKIDAVFSPGDPVTTLTTDVTRELYGFDEHSSGIDREVDATGTVTTQYRAMALTSSGFSVTNARIKLVPPLKRCTVAFSGTGKSREAMYASSCMGVVPLQLGINVLGKLHIYMANREKMLYFTGSDETDTAASSVNASPVPPAPSAGPPTQ